MTRLFTLALGAMLLSPATAFAGKDACKGVKMKKDAFGSSRVFEAGDLKLKFTEGSWIFTLGLNAGGGYGAFASNTSEVLPEGTVVEVLMADDSRVELATSGSTGSQIVVIMGVSVSHYDFPFKVTPDQLKVLTAQPIKAYRVMKGGDAWRTGDAKKGDAKKFAEAGACMLATQ